MKRRTLKSNFVWALSGNIAYGAGQWALLIVIAKLTSPEMVGRFSLAFAITAPIIMFANLNLRSAIATDVSNTYTIRQYWDLRTLMLLLSLLIVGAILIATSYRNEVKLVILAVAASKIFESYSDLLYGILQKRERMDFIAKSLIIKSVLSLMLLTFGLYISKDVLWGAIGLLAAWSILLFVYDFPVNRQALLADAGTPFKNKTYLDFIMNPDFRSAHIVKLARLSLPLGIATLLASLLINIPRYFVENRCGERDLGIFAAISFTMFIGTRIINSLGESAIPRLSQYYSDRNLRAFRRVLERLLIIAIAVGVTGIALAVLAGPQILTILYKSEYAAYQELFIWIMVASALNYIAWVFQYCLTSARMFGVQPVILSVSVLVLILCCAQLVPKFGVIGAALSLVITAVLQLFISIFTVRRLFQSILAHA